jgi:DNA-binding MarR family transcriptional regulator
MLYNRMRTWETKLKMEATMRPELAKVIRDLAFRMRLLKASQEEQVGRQYLTERELFILELLSENGPMSVSQLSLADAGASDSTISSTITRLWRAKRLVTKTISPENQRTTMIGLTNKGKKIIEVLNEQRNERFQTFLEAIDLTDDEEEVMLNVFCRAINFLDERLDIRKVTVRRP